MMNHARFVPLQVTYHEFLLLFRSLEASMTHLTGGINEFQLDLLKSLTLAVCVQRLQ